MEIVPDGLEPDIERDNRKVVVGKVVGMAGMKIHIGVTHGITPHFGKAKVLILITDLRILKVRSHIQLLICTIIFSFNMIGKNLS